MNGHDRGARPPGPPRRGRLWRVVVGPAGAVLVTGALAACGVRPTAAPVNAGVPALRTACPPSAPATTGVSRPPRNAAAVSPVPLAPVPVAPTAPRTSATPSPMPTAPPTTPSCLMTATSG